MTGKKTQSIMTDCTGSALSTTVYKQLARLSTTLNLAAKNLAADEHVVATKAKTGMKQYVKKNPKKFLSADLRDNHSGMGC